MVQEHSIPESLLGLPQAAAKADIPYSTLYWYCRTGEIDGVHRIGKNLYVEKAALAAFVGEKNLGEDRGGA